MFILFSLIVMRISGAIAFNPIFGRNNIPTFVKTSLIFALSLMLYIGFGESLQHEPGSMIEYGVMLIKELLFGFAIGFTMDLTLFVVRFASAIIDFMMGLSMAQIYDPQYNEQTTITSGLLNGFLIMLFFAVNGHIRIISMFFISAKFIPFGMVSFNPELSMAIIQIFRESVVLGLQFAFPILAMELVTEAAVGILMRVIPQINVFVVNFQVKITVGLFMLVFLFNPMSDKLYTVLDYMFRSIESLMPFMR